MSMTREQTQIDVNWLLESKKEDAELKGIQVGLTPSYIEDPTDPENILLVPKISVTATQAMGPREIFLLVDASSSMRGSGIEAVRNTLKLLFAELKNDDVITVRTFSKEVVEIISQTTKQECPQFNQKIDNLETFEGTALYKAILSIGNAKQRIKPGQVTMMVFSDGQDTSEIYKTPVADIVNQYFKAFNGYAPRPFFIAMGDLYNHEQAKRFSIAANCPLIDARDPAELAKNIKCMIDNLAYGVHVDLQMATENKIRLGILNFQSENIQDPIPIKKKTLAAHPVITISVNGKPFSSQLYPIADEITDPIQKQKILDHYVTRELRKIYDDFDVPFYRDKLEKMLVCFNRYANYLSEETKQNLSQFLIRVEQNGIKDRLKNIKKAAHFIVVPTLIDGKHRVFMMPKNGLLYELMLKDFKQENCMIATVEKFKRELIQLFETKPSIAIPSNISIQRNDSGIALTTENSKKLDDQLKIDAPSFQFLQMGSVQSKALPAFASLSAPARMETVKLIIPDSSSLSSSSSAMNDAPSSTASVIPAANVSVTKFTVINNKNVVTQNQHDLESPLIKLLQKDFDDLPYAYHHGIIQSIAANANQSEREKVSVIKEKWNRKNLLENLNALCNISYSGSFPLITSNDAFRYYKLAVDEQMWLKINSEERKNVLGDIVQKVIQEQNQLKMG